MTSTGDPPTQRPRRRLALVLGVGALASGLGLIGYALSDQRHAPQPTRAAAGTTTRTNSVVTIPATVKAVPTPAVPPVSIDIPSIGVHSDVIEVGLNPDRTVEVPQPGPDYNKAAWYRYSPTPGQVGPSIIEGHVDSVSNGPSVFFRLGGLHPGDQVDITLVDHSVAMFTVDGVRAYPKTEFPIDDVYGNTDAPALRLITCGGRFNSRTQHYDDNIVVRASFIGRRA